ncbi:MAG TPA: hypothetical protein DDZ80_13410 [Cyanobacteria bacterium UBA8803]|nr:hypothetical protein [Cyanobacteria bacterium UBA9273]HBL59468.1 hypothetical protein [Cyanobacteria bacterium UBA8803]
MNIQALNIQAGDCIFAYCKNKMQPCTVQRLLDSNHNNVTLKVSTCVPYRQSASYVIQFHREALVELARLKSCRSQTGQQLPLPQGHRHV